MLRQLIIALARRKNPSFTLDSSVKSRVLAGFLWAKWKAWFRALKFISSRRSVLLFCGKNVHVEGGSNAHFGKGVQLGDSLHISAWGSEGLSIGEYSWIGGHSYLKVSFSFNNPGKFIRIGRNVAKSAATRSTWRPSKNSAMSIQCEPISASALDVPP